MSKVLIVVGIKRCADCPMLDREWGACNHVDSPVNNDIWSHESAESVKEWCPLPDEKTT